MNTGLTASMAWLIGFCVLAEAAREVCCPPGDAKVIRLFAGPASRTPTGYWRGARHRVSLPSILVQVLYFSPEECQCLKDFFNLFT